MFNPNNIFHSFLVIPILNILIGLYKLLLSVGIPGALGFSLILLTVLIRLVLHPLTVTQIKSAKKLGQLKPELDKLSGKYKNDKQRLHQEQLKLYQQAGINPAAGCLPLLLQMPILIALYNLFFQLLNSNDLGKVVAEINKVVYLPVLAIDKLDLSFFGMNLAIKPNEWATKGWWLLAVPVATGLLQYWQTRLMTPQAKPKAQNPKLKDNEKKETDKRGPDAAKGKTGEEDMGTVMQKQMAIMMPAMIGFFAYSFPLGLSLYWNTFTVFGIIQQYQITKAEGSTNAKNQKNSQY